MGVAYLSAPDISKKECELWIMPIVAVDYFSA